jgi:TonB family protein
MITAPVLCGQQSADNGRAILKSVQPQYPALAKRMNIKGVVKLEVVVQPNGDVKSMTAKGGHPLLVQAAEDAIRRWKWQPESHETIESIEIQFNPEQSHD